MDKKNQYLNPNVDIFEAEKEITLIIDLAGVPPEALDIQVNGDILSILGTFDQSLQNILGESSISAYKREFTLSKELDTNCIKADLKNGVLQLVLTKFSKPATRKIEVQVI